MEREHEQPRAGQQSAPGCLYLTSGALQRGDENTGDELALARSTPRFYEDEPVIRRAQQWSHYPWAFFRDMPQGCIACQLYKRIKALSKNKRLPYRPNKRKLEETLIITIELRIYAVFFHLLRTQFKALFHSKDRTDPLAVYLSTHGLEEQASLSASFTKLNSAGTRYHSLHANTGHHGVLLLSTTFDFDILEKTGDLKHVLNAAVQEIPGIHAMQTYDIAVNKIFGIFKTSLAKWIDSVAQNSCTKTLVQNLIDLRARSSSDQNLPCPTPFDIQLDTAPEIPAIPDTSAVPVTFLAFPQTTTAAVCVDGIMRYFDPSAVLSILDTSGVMARVCVGALADGSNIPVLAAPQCCYLPSSEAVDEYVYNSTEWPGLEFA